MRAILISEPPKLRLADVAIPNPKDDELLVKVAYAGICGSDVHIRHGKNPRVRYPLIMGHEFSGEVVAVGKGCENSWKVGDKIVANPLKFCGVCEACMRGYWHVCKTLGLTGIDLDGAFAEYVIISASQAIRIPDGVSFDIAALVEPLAVGVHAVHTGNIKLGDRVAILGGGSIGLMIALAARAAGANDIMIVEMNDFRLSVIQEMGFTPIDPKSCDIKNDIWRCTNEVGADVVFEAAGAAATSAQMTGLARIRGTIVMIGVHRQLIGVDLQDVNLRELTIVGSRVYPAGAFSAAVELLPSIPDLQKIATHRFPLEQYEEAFSAMETQRDSLKILLHP